MAYFKAGIILQDRILMTHLDHHADILEYFGIKDDGSVQFVKASYHPSDGDVFSSLDNWKFEIHGGTENLPDWYVPEVDIPRFTEVATQYITQHVLIGQTVDELGVGIWQLKDTTVNKARNATIDNLVGNSVINELRDNSVVKLMQDNACVKEMHENSSILLMRDNSCIENMYESSLIQSMESGTVKRMQGRSMIKNMANESVVELMLDESCVRLMVDNSRISQAEGWSVIEKMFANSSITEINDHCIVRQLTNRGAIGTISHRAIAMRGRTLYCSDELNVVKGNE